MKKTLSLGLRVRVVAAVAGGLNHHQAGEYFGVSMASVNRWRALGREHGILHEHWKTTTFVAALTLRGMLAPSC